MSATTHAVALVRKAIPVGREFTVTEILAATGQREKVVYNALGYLTRKKQLVRTGYGTYRCEDKIMTEVVDKDARIAELEQALRFGFNCNLNDMTARGLPHEWTPGSGMDVMQKALSTSSTNLPVARELVERVCSLDTEIAEAGVTELRALLGDGGR